jgi:hypothetical protein
MVPLEVFPDVARRIADLTPHSGETTRSRR